MSIEFSCTHCGRPLFARDEFAGLLTACPQCETRQLIPPVFPTTPTTPAPPDALAHDALAPRPSSLAPFMCGPNLIDMERVPAAVLARAYDARDLSAAEVLDPYAAAETAPSSLALVRGMCVVTACLTALFLAWLMVGFFHDTFSAVSKATSLSAIAWPVVAWSPVILNCALLAMLIPLTRSLRTGPAWMLLLAGVIVLCAMPLNVGFGMPLPAPDKLINAAAVRKALQLDFNLTAADVRVLATTLFGFTGLLLSLPMWLAGALALHEPKVR
jgi:DNA-directed RNA polymerase subunit RPC12/RpoP